MAVLQTRARTSADFVKLVAYMQDFLDPNIHRDGFERGYALLRPVFELMEKMLEGDRARGLLPPEVMPRLRGNVVFAQADAIEAVFDRFNEYGWDLPWSPAELVDEICASVLRGSRLGEGEKP
ncbi:MAG: hypothetical protein H0U74_19485 [Bradymonadaceae bacterium]|nr:hypothetical protein [Lujinxingiaceae bacterium]